MIHRERKLYCIEALKNFGDVKKDDKGSWIEKESNLNHDGTCWIYGEARVCDSTWVYDNALLSNDDYACNNDRIKRK